MSLSRHNTSSSSSAQQQYDSASEPAKSSHVFYTMPSSQRDRSIPTRIQIYSTQIPKAWVTPFCGAGAGLASGIVTCPLDVIKTKLQAQGGFTTRAAGRSTSTAPLYRGMFGTAKVIWHEDGVRGMYKGLGPMILGYLPTWAVYLTVYDRARVEFERNNNWWLARLYSSVTAGACSAVVTNPIWVIKTRVMSQSNRSASDGMRAPWHYSSTLDAARKMYRSEGIRSFYSGLTPALLGLTHVAVQFPLYECLKMQFTGYGMGQHPNEDQTAHWIGISAATFLSKVCASTATYPHEVIRTRMQTQQRSAADYTDEGLSHGRRNTSSVRGPGPSSSDGMPTRPRYRGIVMTFKTVVQEEGWRALYSGIGVNLIRSVPAAMTTMLTYEWLQKTIHHLQTEGQQNKEPKEDLSA